MTVSREELALREGLLGKIMARYDAEAQKVAAWRGNESLRAVVTGLANFYCGLGPAVDESGAAIQWAVRTNLRTYFAEEFVLMEQTPMHMPGQQADWFKAEVEVARWVLGHKR